MAALAATALAAATVSAAQPVRILLPPTDPTVYSGPCEFDVLIESIKERVTLKEWTDEDGSVRLMFTGQIQLRVTNLSSGTSLDLSLSGPAHIRFAPDGSLIEATGTGRWGILNLGVEPGLFVASGHFRLDYGTLAEFFDSARGRVTDLCVELAA